MDQLIVSQSIAVSEPLHSAGAVSDVVDLVEHPPDPTEPGAVDAGELLAQGLTDATGVGQPRTGDELGRPRRDVRGRLSFARLLGVAQYVG